MLRGQPQGSPRRPRRLGPCFGAVGIRNYSFVGRVCSSKGGRGKPVSMNAKAASPFGAESADLAVHIGLSPPEHSLRRKWCRPLPQSYVDFAVRKVTMISIDPRCCLSFQGGTVRDTHLTVARFVF